MSARPSPGAAFSPRLPGVPVSPLTHVSDRDEARADGAGPNLNILRAENHPSAPLRPIYRLRSRGRIEVLTPRGNWMRRGLIPANGIRVHAPLTESELRWLHGDR